MTLSKSAKESGFIDFINDKEMLSIPLHYENRKGYLVLKRLMDVMGALAGLILLLPLFLMTAVCIKIEDPKGSIFFTQDRVGKNGRCFSILKFRSMVTDAEQQLSRLLDQNDLSGPMFKMKHDPRVTKVGRWIRKTSIDELPQLVNVLIGDMSLVGPRPPLPREVKKYNDYQKQRLLVKPGCTGLWQISGRSSLGFEEMVKLDLQYIRKRSLANDVMILARTIFVLFGSKNAY